MDRGGTTDEVRRTIKEPPTSFPATRGMRGGKRAMMSGSDRKGPSRVLMPHVLRPVANQEPDYLTATGPAGKGSVAWRLIAWRCIGHIRTS